MLLPDTPLPGAVCIAERIRSRIADMRVVNGESVLTVTGSIGCAVLHGDMESTERLADECLYRAKALGRNRIVADEAK